MGRAIEMKERLILFFAAVCVQGGCDLAGRDPESLATTSLALICGSSTCGGNARIAGNEFNELDANPDGTREANGQGLRIREIVKVDEDGTVIEGNLRLEAHGDDLVAFTTDERELRDRDLIGVALLIDIGVVDGAYPPPWTPPPVDVDAPWRLAIVAMDWTPFWVDPAGCEPPWELEGCVPRYEFRYSRGGRLAEGAPLCDEVDDGRGGISGKALIFNGDRYRLDAKTVRETDLDDTWINFACHGTAIAKLHLLRHTLAGGDQATKVKERQAYLNMLVANYCHDDYEFTRTGLRLYYEDAVGHFRDFPDKEAAMTFEAIWGPDGPVCLDEPRLYTELPIAVIAPDCNRPRRCTDDDRLRWRELGYIRSARPLP